MKSLWRHLELNFREGGIRRVFYKLFWRAGQWLRSDHTYLVYRLDLPGYEPTPRLGLERRELTFEDMTKLGYFKALSFPEVIQARIASGGVCHGFLLRGELVNIAWTTDRRILLETDWPLAAPDAIGIFDCFTMPEHRGKGIYADTLITLLQLARQRGIKAALIAVDADNAVSIRGIERVGFQPFRRIRRIRRMGHYSLRESGFALHSGPRPADRTENPR